MGEIHQETGIFTVSYCAMNAKCMKCAGDYDTEVVEHRACANCGNNHFANDKDRPEFKNFLNLRPIQI